VPTASTLYCCRVSYTTAAIFSPPLPNHRAQPPLQRRCLSIVVCAHAYVPAQPVHTLQAHAALECTKNASKRCSCTLTCGPCIRCPPLSNLSHTANTHTRRATHTAPLSCIYLPSPFPNHRKRRDVPPTASSSSYIRCAPHIPPVSTCPPPMYLLASS